jgi:hypothetical protein
MSNILNFSKWKKLYESEMAAELEAGGSNQYAKYRGDSAGTLTALKTIIASKDSMGFWKLSNAVGGILKTIGELDLPRPERAGIASGVVSLLGGKYPETAKYFKNWGESTTWESFTDLFTDEPGRAEGLTDDFKNDFNMPKLASRQ